MDFNSMINFTRKENRVKFKKQEFKLSLEWSRSSFGLKFLMSPYIPGPMYPTYLNEMTTKEVKSLNSKLLKETMKEDKNEE